MSMQTLDFQITGMTCDHCASTLQQALGQVRGVRSATVSYPARQATVALDAGVQAETLINAIRAKGFDATLQSAAVKEPAFSVAPPTSVPGAGAALKVVILPQHCEPQRKARRSPSSKRAWWAEPVSMLVACLPRF